MCKPVEVKGIILHQEAIDFIKSLQENNNESVNSLVTTLTRVTDQIILLADLQEDFGRNTQNALADIVDLKKSIAAFSTEEGGAIC